MAGKSSPLLSFCMNRLNISALLLVAAVMLALVSLTPDSEPSRLTQQYFHQKLTDLKAELVELKVSAPKDRLTQFQKTRLIFKQIEAFIAYQDDGYHELINGANIISVDESNAQYTTVEPQGLQVLEALLVDPETTDEQWRATCSDLERTLQRLENDARRFSFQGRQVIEGVQQQLVRIEALHLNGFDSPLLRNSLQESAASLTSMAEVLDFLKPLITSETQLQCLNTAKDKLVLAAAKLNESSDFEDFDRLTFLKKFMHPAVSALSDLRIKLGVETYAEATGLPAPMADTYNSIYDPNVFNRFFFIRA